MKEGDLVLVDAGAEFRHYAGDVTRTFPVSGRFSDPQRQIYQLVLASMEAGLTHYRPGSSLREAQEATVRVMVTGLVALGILQGEVDQLIAEQKYRAFFMHGLGHWLGLDVHDVGDYTTPARDRTLEPGMVLTCEPGLYIAPDADVPPIYRGIGVRIEDDVLITEAGCEILTEGVVKSVEAIEALMAAARARE